MSSLLEEELKKNPKSGTITIGDCYVSYGERVVNSKMVEIVLRTDRLSKIVRDIKSKTEGINNGKLS